MVSSTYRTGTWLGIVRSGSVIVLEGNTNPDIVNRLWDFLGQDPTIHGVLNEVTNQFGTGLTGLPSFAILVQSDKLHAILRGDITLIAHLNGSAEVVSGRDVSTWSERSLALPQLLELTMADDDAHDGALELPVSEAVVRLQGLIQDIAGDLAAGETAATNITAGAPDVVEFANSGPAAHASTDAEYDAGAPASDGAAEDENAAELAPESAWSADQDADLDGTTAYFPPVAVEYVADQDAEHSADDEPAELAEYDASSDGAGEEESTDFAAGSVPAEPELSLSKQEWFAPAQDAAEQAPEIETAGEQSPEEETAEEQFTQEQVTQDQAAAEQFTQEGSPAPETEAHFDHHSNIEDEEDAYAGFAMAAEAADAEWVAQLAPLQASEADAANDLNLTIRPDMHDEDVAAGDLRDAEFMGQQFHHHDGAHSDSDSNAPQHHEANQDQLAQGQDQVQDQDQDLDQDQDQTQDQTQDQDQPHQPGEGSADDGVAASSPADDGSFTTSYDHLWGPTVTRSVEDAAVRLDENGFPITASKPEQVLPPLPSAPPTAKGEEESQDSDSGQQSQEQEPHTGALHTAGAEQPVESLMIDSVPWGKPGASDAQQEQQQDQQGTPAENEPFDPDHDGQTVMSADVQRDASPAAAPLESRPPTGPMVLARMCLHGHANPPSRSQCSDCGAVLNSEPREVGRPRLGTMHISSGESVELDHSLIIGRQPSVSRVMGGAMPRLVQVKSGNDDISRSHVEVRLDGWDVLLVDLKATNGTVLVREGQAPRRLSQGEEAILLNGDIAELGDGISLLFDGLL